MLLGSLLKQIPLYPVRCGCIVRTCSSTPGKKITTIGVLGENYYTDNWTNVTPRVLGKLGKNLHNQKHHPLNLIRQRIQTFFYANFVNRRGNPLFAVFDNLNPVVSVHQNFDSLLVPESHVSRSKSDTYYINSDRLLRAHTSAHQEELIRMGFDTFLCVGDVYRRDTIDSTHYPVFHQMEGVRLFTENELFSRVSDPTDLTLFEDTRHRSRDKQESHTMAAVALVEHDLKHTLLGLAQKLFGEDLEYRWVDAYFPFTHPSWELEIKWQGEWMEVLGSGIIEQKLLNNAGATGKIGWAFGLGLDRLAMRLYSIPDIRLFWSDDSGFLGQFKVESADTKITYKPISQYPQCSNDVSFWLRGTGSGFSPNDFYDLVRDVGGDLVEQVTLVDEYRREGALREGAEGSEDSGARTSHCYRIVYRHMERTLTQAEVNELHERIAAAAVMALGVELR